MTPEIKKLILDGKITQEEVDVLSVTGMTVLENKFIQKLIAIGHVKLSDFSQLSDGGMRA